MLASCRHFREHDEGRNRDTTKLNFSSGSRVPILGIIGQKDAAHAIISPRNSVRYGMTGGAQRRGSQIFETGLISIKFIHWRPAFLARY